MTTLTYIYSIDTSMPLAGGAGLRARFTPLFALESDICAGAPSVTGHVTVHERGCDVPRGVFVCVA